MARQMTADWSAAQYLKFADERTRPVRDLVAQVPLTSPRRIIDLGCGPGNSTEVLAARYPGADLSGLDSSPDMIAKAKTALPDVPFALADLKAWMPDEPVDLLFSNAVFQWVPGHLDVVARLMRTQSEGGVFAFQVPDNLMEPSHVAMRETAADGPWANALCDAQAARDPMPPPQFYYDRLKPLSARLDIWHTHYQHVLDGPEAIVEWVKGTGLRPFLDPLPPQQREAFLTAYTARIADAYPRLSDGKVMLRFPRLFVVAVRGAH